MEDRIEYSPSLKHRLKLSICGCFKRDCNPHQHHHLDDPSTPHTNNPRLLRSSSDRSTHMIKHKCRHLISRMGIPRGHHHHRKSQSTDFRYDPLSYSLNFDEGAAEDDAGFDELPLRNFSARLRPSPTPPSRSHRPVSEGAVPQPAPASTPSPTNVCAPSREITACS